MSQQTYCTESALEVGEALYGTGSTYDLFLLVEWNQPFGNNAADEFISREFGSISAWNSFWQSLPNPRLQVIKQRGAFADDVDGITLFVAIPREANPLLYEFRLKRYADLLTLDITGLFTGELDYRSNLRESPLYLVCTNGKHDLCCARWGAPVYDALREAVGETNVWQSSHIGGHRFAGTLIAFPDGIYYGRVSPTDVPALVASSHSETHLSLAHYRGRACYSRAEQAAEYLLRQQTGRTAVSAFRLLRSDRAGDLWTVRFEDAEHQVHAVEIVEQRSTWAAPTSCSSAELKQQPVFNLHRYSTTEPKET